MALTIRRADYFRCIVKDRPGEAYQILTRLSGANVNLLAFSAVPLDVGHTQVLLFPESMDSLSKAAETDGLILDGPHPALLIQGDDALGALADIHAQLFDARVNVYSSTGVADGRGGFGYIVYVRPDDFEAAAGALGI